MRWIIRALPVVSLGLMSSCDSPSVAFMGSPKTVVVIEESTFSVHRRDDRVEVYRTSFEMLPNRLQVLGRAELAIEQATGCTVWKGTLNGDQALIKARLACGGQASQPPLATNLHYDCQIVDTWDLESRDVSVEAIECDLVTQ